MEEGGDCRDYLFSPVVYGRATNIYGTHLISQAYLAPHDSDLLMELAPVETRIFL